jgi:hypothetical protein
MHQETPGTVRSSSFKSMLPIPQIRSLFRAPAQESSYVQASPLAMLTDQKGAYLYVGLAGAQAAGTNVYAERSGNASTTTRLGRHFAMSTLVALCTLAGCGGGSSAAQNAPIVPPAVTPQGTTTNHHRTPRHLLERNFQQSPQFSSC